MTEVNNTINAGEIGDMIKNHHSKLTSPLILVHQDHQVGFYRYPLPEEFEFQYLLELRMFGEEGEFFLWRAGDGEFRWRWREGRPQNGEQIYSEDHYIWGNDLQKPGEVTILKEKGSSGDGRGLEVRFHFDLGDSSHPLSYKVENYYSFNELGIIQFCDARIVKVMDSQNKNIQ